MTDTFEVKDLTVELLLDENPQSPRDWDNVGTMVCWHSQYNLGDKQPRKNPREYSEELGDDVLTLPLYLFDHSGLTMRTSPFSCPWDSGQVGFIYVRKDTEGLNDEQLLKILEAEVDLYDKYLIGDVWGYRVTAPDGENLDSCWDFYGYEECRTQAREAAEGWVITRQHDRQDRLKTLIRTHVPLMVRERELRV